MNNSTSGGETASGKMAKESFMKAIGKWSWWILWVLKQSFNKRLLSTYYVLGVKSHHLHDLDLNQYAVSG